MNRDEEEETEEEEDEEREEGEDREELFKVQCVKFDLIYDFFS